MLRSRFLRAAFAVALAGSLSLAAPALEPPKPAEKWISLQVAELRFISGVSPRETLEIARDLLRMRAAVGKVSGLTGDGAEPTRVFVFPDRGSFTRYCAALQQRTCTANGLFVPAFGGDFIVIPGREKDLDRIVYHELTHQLLENTAGALPRWLNEGLADYYSTFRTDGTRTLIGDPIEWHVHRMRTEKPIPLRDFFAIASPKHTQADGFYAQSWALVHYLMHDLDRAKFRRFVSLIRGGKPEEVSFAEVYGLSLPQLRQALRTYVGAPSFTTHSYDLGELDIPELPEPSAMPHDAVVHQFGRLLGFTHLKNAAVAERFLKQSLGANDTNAAAYADLAYVYEITGRTAEADAAYARMMQLGTGDAEVYLLAGRTLSHRKTIDLLKLRPIFRRATELDPKSAEAWAGLGETYLGDPDRATGIAALEKCLELDPGHDKAAFHLAQLYANDARFSAARKLAQAMLERTTDAAHKKQIENVLAAIEDNEVTYRAVATLDEAVEKASAGKYQEALTIIDAALANVRHDPTRQQILLLRERVAAEVRPKK